MDSSLGQFFKGLCLAVLLSSVSGSVPTCTGKGIQLRQSRGHKSWNCDGESRQVEVLCDSQLGTISNGGKDDIAPAICSQLGCDGGESDHTRNNDDPRADWIVNCKTGDKFSLEGCTFIRAEPRANLSIRVKCNAGLNGTSSTLITIDMVEFVMFCVIILVAAFFLYHLVMYNFKSSFIENDKPESQAMLSSSHVMVQVEKKDANQPEATEQADTELKEFPELVDNICYEATIEKARQPSKHETTAHEATELEETTELVDNVCYEATTQKAGHSLEHDMNELEDTELGEIPELVYNVCYGAITEKEGLPYQTETKEEEYEEMGQSRGREA